MAIKPHMLTSTTPQTPRLSTPSYPHDKGRFKIIIAYWLVLIAAGPAWWVLTTVQRLPLPEVRVKEASSQSVRIPIDVNVDVTDGLCDATMLAAKLQISWDKSHGTELHDIWNVLDVRIGALGSHRPDTFCTTYNVTVRYGYDDDPQLCTTVPLNYSAAVDVTQLVGKVTSSLRALLAPPTQNTELRVAQYSPKYRLAFSLLNEDAAYGGAISGWSVETAIKEYLQPTLDELNILHNFTIESQVQFYAPLTTEPIAAQDGYALNQEQLTIFVNSAEWTLSSSVSNDPVLHFVLFVPSLARRPLYIQDVQGKITQFNSFLLPQWGGVAIMNPKSDGTANSVLTLQDLRPIFHIFRKQLEGLLGVPVLPPPVGLQLDRAAVSKQVLTGWQLDTLLRRRALENIRGSVQTLNSIIDLTGQIENMPIGLSVRNDILSALEELSQTHNATHPAQTLTHSALSLQFASRAFFNPSMVGLLYFPAEHKYAVYTPLFAPIAVPLVVSVIRELKSRRKGVASTGRSRPKAE
ncbi:Phosphatidylinositol-glycan biosynthesis class S protein [Rhizoctonia solani]|uniref:Phosphatidylinositol-glycan biosynthesis class S protein n=1 Tax=Rhizoctonia solani TaxID=456999 RepID=A0A8H7IM87_9AGAM|nr:Phosphatidylinositol-glycan biosynthesis class S protein [Rhizoctonia solani]